jgi:hypothetical protein
VLNITYGVEPLDLSENGDAEPQSNAVRAGVSKGHAVPAEGVNEHAVFYFIFYSD